MPAWDKLAPEQKAGYDASLKPLTNGLTEIMRLVSYQRSHYNEVTDHRTAYQSLMDQIWAVGQPIIDTEQLESEMADYDPKNASGGND